MKNKRVLALLAQPMSRLVIINLAYGAGLIALLMQGGWYVYPYSIAMCVACAVLRFEWPGWLYRWLVLAVVGDAP